MLNEYESADLTSKLNFNYYKKNSIIIKSGIVCDRIFFIEKGLVKHRYNLNDREKTVRFFSEDELFTSIGSYSEGTPAKYDTIALEDTTVSSILYSDLEDLTKKHLGIMRLMDKIFSDAAHQILKLMHTYIDLDAASRYQLFEDKHPHLSNRLALKEIANHLEISQVTLSRIRAARVSKNK